MNTIQHPTLLIDKQKCLHNIRRMKSKADANNLVFRPHFKTHQSGIIGELFKKEGVEAITVSSVQMALQFIYSGWKNISIAIPFNLRETSVINLISQDVNINLLVDSIESIEHLCLHLKRKVGLFIKIDNGYHRTGLAYDDFDLIDKIIFITTGDEHLNFKGFLTHAGNTYDAKDKAEVLEIFEDNKSKLLYLKEKYKDLKPIISYGDTPSCSIAEDFEGIDEIRPGNFVYYDLMQYELGSCSIEDIAVAVACPVISKNTERQEIVLYGGAVHLSKEHLKKGDQNNYGLIVPVFTQAWGEPFEDTFIFNISQEHGVISTSKKIFNEINIGDLLGVLPVHSCLAANLMKDSQVVI